MKRVGIKDLLAIAEAIERSGHEIFLDLRRRHSDTPELADIFSRLAADEEKHLETLRDYERRYAHHTLPLSDLYQLGVVKDYFRNFSYHHLMRDYARLAKRGTKIRHPHQAVRLAIDLELDSILFYERFRELNRDLPDVDALLKDLLRFELSHLDTLTHYLRSSVDA